MINELDKEIILLWGSHSSTKSPKQHHKSYTVEQQSPFLDESVVQETLEHKIFQMKHELQQQLTLHEKTRNQATMKLIKNGSLDFQQFQQILLQKDQQYLCLFSQLLEEQLERKIQRIRLLTLAPQSASNIQLRSIILELKKMIVEIEGMRLDNEERMELIQNLQPLQHSELEWEQFDNKVMVIKEESEEVAERLREMIRKKEQSKSRISQVSFSKVEHLSDTMKMDQKIIRLQKQLEKKADQIRNMDQKYKLMQNELKQSTSLVSELRSELSKINARQAQKYAIMSLERKLQKLKLTGFYGRKNNNYPEKSELPITSGTLTGSQRSIDARIEQGKREIRKFELKVTNNILRKQ